MAKINKKRLEELHKVTKFSTVGQLIAHIDELDVEITQQKGLCAELDQEIEQLSKHIAELQEQVTYTEQQATESSGEVQQQAERIVELEAKIHHLHAIDRDLPDCAEHCPKLKEKDEYIKDIIRSAQAIISFNDEPRAAEALAEQEKEDGQ